MEVFLPIAQVFINPIEILLLSAIVGILSGLFGVGGGFLMTPFLIFLGVPVIINYYGSNNIYNFHFKYPDLSGIIFRTPPLGSLMSSLYLGII